AILEEHLSIGKPNHCSGLVSKNLDFFVKPDDRWIEHRVSGCIIRAGFSELVLKKPSVAAYVIDREEFDQYLVERLNSRIFLGTRAESISIEKNYVSTNTNKGMFVSEILAGCDGANSVVARLLNSGPKKLLNGVIAITREKDFSPYVEIFIEKGLSPDGFLWKIPRGEKTEYGMFSRNADFSKLEGFFSLKRPYERRAGIIPIGPNKTFFERALLIGDAAGMSKPWSGGGLIYGLTATRIASETISKAFQEGEFSEKFLSEYERLCKNSFGRQIQMGMFGRKIFNKINNGDVEIALKFLKIFTPFLNKLDMDFIL
ncbi:MAG: NAD(P)/FAD-dependent oxidoreductase, partial [Candidatus Aenigmatarchaeota archaeon]